MAALAQFSYSADPFLPMCPLRRLPNNLSPRFFIPKQPATRRARQLSTSSRPHPRAAAAPDSQPPWSGGGLGGIEQGSTDAAGVSGDSSAAAFCDWLSSTAVQEGDAPSSICFGLIPEWLASAMTVADKAQLRSGRFSASGRPLFPCDGGMSDTGWRMQAALCVAGGCSWDQAEDILQGSGELLLMGVYEGLALVLRVVAVASGSLPDVGALPNAGSGGCSSASSLPPACAIAAELPGDVWQVLEDSDKDHATELVRAGHGRVSAAMDALTGHLGWPPQLASRMLLGQRRHRPAMRDLLAALGGCGGASTGSSCADGQAGQCQLAAPDAMLLRETLWFALEVPGALRDSHGTTAWEPERTFCMSPAALLNCDPAHVAGMADWLGSLGFDRPTTALVTATAQLDWLTQSSWSKHLGSGPQHLRHLRVKSRQWAEEAGLVPETAAAAGLWLAGGPPDSPLAAHFARLSHQGISEEQLRQLLIAVMCDNVVKGPLCWRQLKTPLGWQW